MLKDIKYIKVWQRYLKRETGTVGDVTVNGSWKYELFGIIDVFGSAIFNSSFGGRGDFELTLPYNDFNLRMLHLDTDAEREKFIASQTAVDGHNYISLSIYLTVDGINDIFCVEKITFERNDNGALYIVISGSNGIGLFDGLFVGQTRVFGKTVDGTTTPVKAITGRKMLLSGFNTSGGAGFGKAYPNLCALVADGFRNAELGDELLSNANLYANQRGYNVVYQTDTLYWNLNKNILDSDGNKYTPSWEPAELSALILDFCEKYKMGFEYGFIDNGDGTWQAVVTVKDTKGSGTILLRDEMPIIKNPTLTLDLTKISEQYIALGAKDNEDNFYTYGTDTTGNAYESATLYARRIIAKESNLTTDDNTYTTAYRNQLYNLAVKSRKLDAQESVTGSIAIMNAGTTVLEDDIYLGNCKTLEIFGRKMDIYITNMTYVKDTGGFSISCDYALQYQK